MPSYRFDPMLLLDLFQLGVNGIRSHLQSMYTKLRNAVNVLDGGARQKALMERVSGDSLHPRVFSRLLLAVEASCGGVWLP
jgi:hypothetical protein